MWYGSAFGLPGHTIGTYILYIALFISLFSGYNYLSDFFTAMKKKTADAIRLEQAAGK
jgi:hypothetical protein